MTMLLIVLNPRWVVMNFNVLAQGCFSLVVAMSMCVFVSSKIRNVPAGEFLRGFKPYQKLALSINAIFEAKLGPQT